MMLELVAVGVSAGFGKGKAYVIQKKQHTISREPAADVDAELARFGAALEGVIQETRQMARQARAKTSGSAADILEAYLTLLLDPAVTDGVRELISSRHNAADAVDIGIGSIVTMFESMEDAYMRERSYDILDIRRRLLDRLLNVEPSLADDIPPDSILVTEELTPSDTVKLDMKRVCGIITVLGGQNSHASIVARSLDIPAVVGAERVLETVRTGDEILVDGSAGEIYIFPTREIAESFERRKDCHRREQERLRDLHGKPTATRDGLKVRILANLGRLEELSRVVDTDTDGVGLFRTEFLFADGTRMPDEETQFQAYRQVAQGLAGKPVVVRTMDIGGEKNIPSIYMDREENPSLGYRGIRIQLDRMDLLRTQLRAILRASHHGNLRIMFPMISCVEELRTVKGVLAQVKEELRSEGVPFRDDIQVGTMIEVPSAALMADFLAMECDFFSIGTNDLIQYTAAVDRSNIKVSHLYSHYQPAVLRLIAQTVKAAKRAGIHCEICGEAAGDILLIPALIGMGIQHFSTHPGAVLKCRSRICQLTVPETRYLAKAVLACATTQDVQGLLESFAGWHQ